MIQRSEQRLIALCYTMASRAETVLQAAFLSFCRLIRCHLVAGCLGCPAAGLKNETFKKSM